MENQEVKEIKEVKENREVIENQTSEEELRQKLKERILSLKNRWKNISKEEMDLLFKFTNFLPEDTSLQERRKYFISDLREIQKCPVCGKKTQFIMSKQEIGVFCSKECFESKEGDLYVSTKRKKTCMSLYGVEVPLQSEEIMQKVRETNKERFGCEYAGQAESVKEKMKETCLEKYGCENPSQSEIVKEKIKETCKKKYGCEYAGQAESVKEKNERNLLREIWM